MATESQIAAIRRRQKELGVRTRPAPNVRFPMGIEREYRRTLRKIVREFFDAVNEVIIDSVPSLVREANALRPDRQDDYAKDVQSLIAATNVLFKNRAPNEQVIAETYAEAISSNNVKQLDKVAKATLGVNLFIKEPYLPDMLNSFTAENVKLINSLSANESLQIEGILQRGLSEGKSATEISREIKARTGVAQRRADLIARDQVATLNGQLSKVRMQNVGVQRAIWVTAGDERVRESHQVRNGQEYDINKGIAGEFPGGPINCFPGHSKLVTFSGVRKMYKRHYTGDMIIITTDEGYEIEATPNHPILTDEGWVAAGELCNGMVIYSASNKDQSADSSLEREVVFDECYAVFADLFGEIGTVTETDSFHGDGDDSVTNIVSFGSPKDVSYVMAESLLFAILEWSDNNDVDFDPTVAKCLKIGMTMGCMNLDHTVESLCKFLTMLNDDHSYAAITEIEKVDHFDEVGAKLFLRDIDGGSVPLYEVLRAENLSLPQKRLFSRQIYSIVTFAIAFEQAHYDIPSDDEIADICYGDNVHEDDFETSLDLKPHRIVSILETDYHGFVYNLETPNNYYAINSSEVSLVVHNCRCIAQPIMSDALNSN